MCAIISRFSADCGSYVLLFVSSASRRAVATRCGRDALPCSFTGTGTGTTATTRDGDEQQPARSLGRSAAKAA